MFCGQLVVKSKFFICRGGDFVVSTRAAALVFRLLGKNTKRNCAVVRHLAIIHAAHNGAIIVYVALDERVVGIVGKRKPGFDFKGVVLVRPAVAGGACRHAVCRKRDIGDVVAGIIRRKCPHGQDAQYHADCQQKTDEPLFHVIHLLCFDPLGMYSAIETFRRFYSGSILL